MPLIEFQWIISSRFIETRSPKLIRTALEHKLLAKCTRISGVSQNTPRMGCQIHFDDTYRTRKPLFTEIKNKPLKFKFPTKFRLPVRQKVQFRGERGQKKIVQTPIKKLAYDWLHSIINIRAKLAMKWFLLGTLLSNVALRAFHAICCRRWWFWWGGGGNYLISKTWKCSMVGEVENMLNSLKLITSKIIMREIKAHHYFAPRRWKPTFNPISMVF